MTGCTLLDLSKDIDAPTSPEKVSRIVDRGTWVRVLVLLYNSQLIAKDLRYRLFGWHGWLDKCCSCCVWLLQLTSLQRTILYPDHVLQLREQYLFACCPATAIEVCFWYCRWSIWWSYSRVVGESWPSANAWMRLRGSSDPETVCCLPWNLVFPFFIHNILSLS